MIPVSPIKRAAKVRKGFKGLWDKLNGKYWKQRKTNEKETHLCQIRDQLEREHLIKNQLIQRQNLQVSLNQLQHNHEKDHAPTREEIMQRKSQQGKGQSQPNTGMEPEI